MECIVANCALIATLLHSQTMTLFSSSLPISVQVLLACGLLLFVVVAGRLLKATPALILPLVAVPTLAFIFQNKNEMSHRPAVRLVPPVIALPDPPQVQPDTPQVLVVRTKQNVYPDKLDTALLRALPTIVRHYQNVMGETYQPVITSANDGEEHHRKSAHYQNKAIDFRANNLNREQAVALHSKLQAALGPRYLILLESSGSSNQHLHVETRD